MFYKKKGTIYIFEQNKFENVSYRKDLATIHEK